MEILKELKLNGQAIELNNSKEAGDLILSAINADLHSYNFFELEMDVIFDCTRVRKIGKKGSVFQYTNCKELAQKTEHGIYKLEVDYFSEFSNCTITKEFDLYI